MGISSSSIGELHKNEYLQRFAGKEHISPNDPFWNQLLSFTFRPPYTSSDYRLLEESTHELCKSLLTNNNQSGNFASLVQVFLMRSHELKASAQCHGNIFLWHMHNVLFILRSVIKYFLESITEEDFVEQFRMQQKDSEDLRGSQGPAHLLEPFMNGLVELMVDVPIMDITYSLHLEAAHSLLVLFSVQLYLSKPAYQSIIYRTMMAGRCSIHAGLLMKHLLGNYLAQLPLPPHIVSEESGGSIILGLASGLWSVLTLGYSKVAPHTPKKGDGKDSIPAAPLAEQSLLLILVLSNHCTSDKSLPNPYRQALLSFTDSKASGMEAPHTQAVATFRMDYAALYDTLCSGLKSDQATLLLYLLLHRNPHFRTFVLARTDVERLVLPLLETLYKAGDHNSHHIYMALIVLLILSEDDPFNSIVHDIILNNIEWYTERSIPRISLGGLLVLVVIRTIQYNLTKMRDKYLHTNCLAALANMSSQFRNLHPYVCQRLASLLALLSKKRSKLLQLIPARQQMLPNHHLQDQEAKDGADPHVITVNGTTEDESLAEMVQDLCVLEEVIRMLLEILNSTLTYQLAHNTDLIYTLLYRRDMFEPFRSHAAFQDITHNIDMVLSYFSSRLEPFGQQLGVSDVQRIIAEAVQTWHRERLKKFPELKFKYVEEEEPEDYFIPYIWSLIFHHAMLYWNPQHFLLFSPSKTDGVKNVNKEGEKRMGELQEMDLGSLMEHEIPEGRQNLVESHSNLDRVAEYCESNYLQAENKGLALQETKGYTIQSLACVAYQINSLAYNFLKMLDAQQTQLLQMESDMNHIAQQVMIHKEKVARREIGVLTTNKSSSRQFKIVAPANQERPIKYVRKPIDYTALDEIGHGLRNMGSTGTTPRSRRSSNNQMGIAAGPAPNTKPPTPPQGIRTPGGTLVKRGSDYKTPPAVAPPQVPTHYAPNYGLARQGRLGSDRSSGSGYSTLPMHLQNNVVGNQHHGHVGVVHPSNTVGRHSGYASGMSMNQQGPHIHNPPPPQSITMPPPPSPLPPMAGGGVDMRGSPPLPPPPGTGDEQPYAPGRVVQTKPPDWVPRNYIEKVVAIYDYMADKEDELSFPENAVIYVLKKNDDGWWEGVMNGVQGLFPGNYVEPCV